MPVSGGGLASGTALATLAMKGKDCTKVIGVEPEGKELGPCLKAGARLWSDPPVFLATAAEGIRTQQLGHLTFPIVCDLVEQGENMTHLMDVLFVLFVRYSTYSQGSEED